MYRPSMKCALLSLTKGLPGYVVINDAVCFHMLGTTLFRYFLNYNGWFQLQYEGSCALQSSTPDQWVRLALCAILLM